MSELDKVYLSRKNLLTLLSKLDRVKKGEESSCTIVKRDNQHPVYPQTVSFISVVAVEDEDYYIDREAGEIHSKDDPNKKTQGKRTSAPR